MKSFSFCLKFTRAYPGLMQRENSAWGRRETLEEELLGGGGGRERAYLSCRPTHGLHLLPSVPFRDITLQKMCHRKAKKKHED